MDTRRKLGIFEQTCMRREGLELSTVQVSKNPSLKKLPWV